MPPLKRLLDDRKNIETMWPVINDVRSNFCQFLGKFVVVGFFFFLSFLVKERNKNRQKGQGDWTTATIETKAGHVYFCYFVS